FSCAILLSGPASNGSRSNSRASGGCQGWGRVKRSSHPSLRPCDPPFRSTPAESPLNQCKKLVDTPPLPVYNTSMSDTITQMVCFRTDPVTKRRIEEAARQRAQSVTTFVREAVMKAVEKAEASGAPKRAVHGGVPTYFRAFCLEASRGGKLGYKG